MNHLKNDSGSKKVSLFAMKNEHIDCYIVKTVGKHPIHMIEGGAYVTEDERDFGVGDMGWFNLNERDYKYYKANEKPIKLEIIPIAFDSGLYFSTNDISKGNITTTKQENLTKADDKAK